MENWSPDQNSLKKMAPPGPVSPEKIGPPDQFSLKKMVPPDQNSMENWSIVGPKFSGEDQFSSNRAIPYTFQRLQGKSISQVVS